MASSTDANVLTVAEWDALAKTQRHFTTMGLHGFDASAAERLWTVRNAQLTADRLQPYNDMLFTYLKGVIDFRGAVAALMEKIKVARSKNDLCVPIWEYKDYPLPHGYYNEVEYSHHIQAYRAGDLTAKRAEIISANGWRGLVGSTQTNEWYGDTEFHLQLKDIDYIFRKTDLKQRLALEFGGHYFYITVHRESEQQTIGDLEFYPTRCKVMLQYFPHTLPADKRKQLAIAALKYESHVPYNSSRDTLVLENGTECIQRRIDLYGDAGRL